MLTQSVDMANVLWELYEKVSPVAFGVAMTVPLVLAAIQALTSFNLTGLFELLKKLPLCKNEGKNVYTVLLVLFMFTHPIVCGFHAHPNDLVNGSRTIIGFFLMNVAVTGFSFIGTLILATPIVITLMLIAPARNIAGAQKIFKESKNHIL